MLKPWTHRWPKGSPRSNVGDRRHTASPPVLLLRDERSGTLETGEDTIVASRKTLTISLPSQVKYLVSDSGDRAQIVQEHHKPQEHTSDTAAATTH